MTYMPIRVVTMELKHRDSPKLAEILTKWMWTRNMTYSVWIYIPTDENRLSILGQSRDTRDIWGVWADFRTLCTNYPMQKLAVGLTICPDLADEFLDPRLYKRWLAEPLCSFCIETAIFTSSGRSGECTLPPAHYRLLTDLFVSAVQRPLIHCDNAGRIDGNLRLQYVNAIKQLMLNKACRSKAAALLGGDNVLHEDLIHQEYVDTLQIPLQPLADNLDSSTYAIFEEDSIKYDLYREAVSYAIEDLIKLVDDERNIVVYLLGAGRGPLMQMIIEAEELFNAKHRNRQDLLRLQLYSLEKNAHANVTLRYRNQYHWRGRIKIIEDDMRKLGEKIRDGFLPPPDLIVSELLGSFGDNELCPECLDGITDVLRPTTISIPQQYTSYVAPIQSVRLYQKILCCFGGARYFERGYPGRGRLESVKQHDGSYLLPECPEASHLDEIYVVCMRSICELAKPEPVFTFKHPNFEQKSNAKCACIHFSVDMQSELMGFAGYFDAQLYGNCHLSIVPQTHSKGLVSWFPALIPLRQLYRLQAGEQITFHIERKVDSQGVWYEWFCDLQDVEGNVRTTPLQNKDGMSCFMRL